MLIRTGDRCLWALLMIVIVSIGIVDSSQAAPMPSMLFEFEYRIPPVEIIEATLYECEDAACVVSEVPEYGGQDRCEGGICRFEGLIADYYRLDVEFEDRVRESQPFEKISLNATFSVAVEETELIVTELNPQRPGLFSGMVLLVMIVGLILIGATIGVELIVGGLIYWLLVRRGLLPILGWIAGMNFVTTILLIIVAGANRGESVLATIIVILIEAGGLLLGGRRSGLTVPKALLISLAMNVAGYFVRVMLLA